MAVNKWMAKLQKHEGAVLGNYDPFAHVVRSPSPSFNFVFGKSHGLPLGFILALWGPAKGGKSVILNAMIGQTQKDYEDAICIKYNTEMRELGQLTPAQAAVWGIDRDRYVAYDTNRPDLIFDHIETDVAAMCQDGAPIKLIGIDSLNNIQGRRALNADTVMTQQIGDMATTLGDGIKRIIPVLRQHKIALVVTLHQTAEMDQAEQMRGNKVKMSAPFKVQHYAEYFMYVEPDRTKAGRTTLDGQVLEDENLGDMRDKGAEKTGHKIRVQMKDSSMGPKGRVGEFTLDYDFGIINTHEEVFLLAKNRNIIQKVNNLTYAFGDKKWTGQPAMLQALKEDRDLCNSVISELKRRDLAGRFASEDAKSAETVSNVEASGIVE